LSIGELMYRSKDHLVDVGGGSYPTKLDLRVFKHEDPKYFVSESLSYGFQSIKVQKDS